jgi:hypothetical protein
MEEAAQTREEAKVQELLPEPMGAAENRQGKAIHRHQIRVLEALQAVGPERRGLRVGIIPVEGPAVAEEVMMAAVTAEDPAVEAVPAAEVELVAEAEGVHARLGRNVIRF